MKIRVAHLYPDYLNIYADRGNIAVLARRAALRGHALEVTGVEPGDELAPSDYDLVYVGGGQDREQALVAPDLAERGEALREAVVTETAVLAVCGGYQLLGRGYRGRDGSWLPGAGVFPLETVAGTRRLIGDVLLEADLGDGVTVNVAGFENHAGRTLLDVGATALGRVLAGHGNDGASGFRYSDSRPRILFLAFLDRLSQTAGRGNPVALSSTEGDCPVSSVTHPQLVLGGSAGSWSSTVRVRDVWSLDIPAYEVGGRY